MLSSCSAGTASALACCAPWSCGGCAPCSGSMTRGRASTCSAAPSSEGDRSRAGSRASARQPRP